MESPSGFLLINKPAGMTSHDVIDQLRRITGIRKIGHAGTLDPFATGLLIVAVGREATREISKFVGLDKAYEAEFVLGATTETLDPEGDIIRADKEMDLDASIWTREQIESAMQSLTGPIKQVPPMYSAIKQKGKKLYELAREGKTVKRPPRDVTVSEFDLIGNPSTRPTGSLRMEDTTAVVPVHIACSSGTYIRALARDLAQELGTTGYVRILHRSSIGPFTDKEATNLADITPENWQTLLQNLTISPVDDRRVK